MSTDNLTIRADVSPSLHPEVLSPHAEALAEKPGALATGQNALAAAYRYLGVINDAEKALQATVAPRKRRQHPTGQSELLGDLRMGGAGWLKRCSSSEELLAEAAGEALERISKQIDRARGELVATAEMLDKQIAHALTDPAGDTGAILAMQTEIRAHVKGLPDKDRSDFVRSAIKAGDIATTAATDLVGQQITLDRVAQHAANGRDLMRDKVDACGQKRGQTLRRTCERAQRA
jgi:hypothetical protein